MQFALKEVLIQEVPILLPLIESYYQYDHLIFHEKAILAAVCEIIENNQLGKIFFLTQDQVIIGYAVLSFSFSLEFHGKIAVLDEFFIQDSFRGQGLASKVFEQLKDYCLQRQIKAIRLEVEHTNQHAQYVYKKNSFHLHPRGLMTWPLSPELKLS